MSVSIKELIDRPIIRDDHCDENMNKMTDEEIHQWESEVREELDKVGFKDAISYSASFLSKTIDREILYQLFKNS